jgi:hypothetical protein
VAGEVETILEEINFKLTSTIYIDNANQECEWMKEKKAELQYYQETFLKKEEEYKNIIQTYD